MRWWLHSAGVTCCAVAWAFAAAIASPVEARRVALVVGNADYKVGPLLNPIGDATAVAEAFEKKLGFEKVILKKNLGLNSFRAALDELAREVSGADIGVIFFAGHGVEVGGKNFLIPVDATLARAAALDLEAIALEAVLAQLEGVRELRLVILDACRNNPFALRGGKRSLGQGLARVEPDASTLIVYAAKHGTTADDGVGRAHSPFTQALLKHLATPDIDVRILFGLVRDDVASATGMQQLPHVYSNLGGKEYFLFSKLASVGPPVVKTEPAPGSLSEAERAWSLIQGTASIALLEAFRRQYGAANTLFDRLAAERIDALRAETKLKAEEKLRAEEKLKAEEKRRADERLKAEEKRRAEEKLKAEEKRRAEERLKAEEKRRAEEKLKAEEKRRAEERLKAEEKRRAEERLKAEEKRRAEEKLKAEEKRRAEEKLKAEEQTKVAAAVTGQAAPSPQTPPPAPVPPDLVLLLQTELKRVGCDPGIVDGRWGEKVQSALQKFAHYARAMLPTGEPTIAALDAVKRQRGRICPLECGPNAVETKGACVAKVPPYQAPPKTKAAPAPKKAPPLAAPKASPKAGATCWKSDFKELVPCGEGPADKSRKAY